MSGFLLDTNVPSEIIRRQPHPRVNAWFFAQDETTLYLNAITIGELRKVCRQAALQTPYGARKLDDGRSLAAVRGADTCTHAISDRWGVLSGQRKLVGRPLAMADGLIAATALERSFDASHNNVRDYEDLDVPISNPCEA